VNLYLDTSALVKQYIIEDGSTEVHAVIHQAGTLGTALITRAEMSAVFAKAVRLQAITQNDARARRETFRREWLDLVRLEITDGLVARVVALACQYQLRGYDAGHLAAAVIWRETLDAAVTFATYDKTLWARAHEVGLEPFPPKL